MTSSLKQKDYIDVTKEWLSNHSSLGKVKDAKYYEYDNKLYFVDGKNVILDYSKYELKIAKYLAKTFGGVIYMIPKIINDNLGNGIKTPDYIWNNEGWDLKTPKYKNNYKNLFNDLFKKKKSKLQANNFIIDLNNYKNILNTEIDLMLLRLINNPYRKWIEGLIIIKNKKIYKVYKKKPSSS